MSLVISFGVLALVVAVALVLSRDVDHDAGEYTEGRITESDSEFASHSVGAQTPAARNSSIVVPSNYLR